jgi:hypothetical protein
MSEPPPPVDELLEQLTAARARAGRGNIRQRRKLWRFCARAFREWHGVQTVADAPIVLERRLTPAELAAWIRLAEDLPAVARDVLKLQRAAASAGKRIKLSDVRWSDERRKMLLELHHFALLGAHQEAERARASHRLAVLEKAHFSDAGREQRRRMVVAAERVCLQLSEQLQSLRNVKTVSDSTL